MLHILSISKIYDSLRYKYTHTHTHRPPPCPAESQLLNVYHHTAEYALGDCSDRLEGWMYPNQQGIVSGAVDVLGII